MGTLVRLSYRYINNGADFQQIEVSIEQDEREIWHGDMVPFMSPYWIYIDGGFWSPRESDWINYIREQYGYSSRSH